MIIITIAITGFCDNFRFASEYFSIMTTHRIFQIWYTRAAKLQRVSMKEFAKFIFYWRLFLYQTIRNLYQYFFHSFAI